MTISDKLALKTILAREGINGVLQLLRDYCADLASLNRTDPEIHAYWEDQREVIIETEHKINTLKNSLP